MNMRKRCMAFGCRLLIVHQITSASFPKFLTMHTYMCHSSLMPILFLHYYLSKHLNWGVFTLTWYTCICASLLGRFFADFGIERSGVFITDEGTQFTKNWVYFEQMMVKAPNLSKIGCFFVQNWYIDGR